MPSPTTPVAVASVTAAARGLALLVLEPHAALAAAHSHAGQFCALRTGEVSGHFALIDPPGAPSLRFLIRDDTPFARALSPGVELAVTGPQGQGFPLQHAQGHDVLLVSAGTGIGATRAVLLALPAQPGRSVWLYHGTYSAAHVPFASELEAARARGVHVSLAFSHEASGTAVTRQVHDALAHERPALHNAVVYVAAMPALIDTLRAELPALGVAPERIYLNY